MIVESGFGFLKKLFTFVGKPGCRDALTLALNEMAHTGGGRSKKGAIKSASWHVRSLGRLD